jgi:hypothetical protein
VAKQQAGVGLSPNLIPMVCALESGIPAGFVLPSGVKARRCAGCGVRVLASPSSLRKLDAGGFQLTCEPCTRHWQESGTEAVAVVVTPDAADEYKRLCERAQRS